MRGFLIVRLQEYIQAKFGKDAWVKILHSVDIPKTKLYFSHTNHPDEEFYRIIMEAVKISGMQSNPFFEEFGYSLGPLLLNTLKTFIKPNWKVIDVLEHIQEFNYRLFQQGEQPVNMGKFEAKRLAQDKIVLEYTSPRQLCHFAIGLFKAIAHQMGEEIIISQSRCMLQGSEKCVMEIISAQRSKETLAKLAKLNKSFA